MVRTFLKVYMELGFYFLFLQEQIKDIIIRRTPALINTCHDARLAPHVGTYVNAGYRLTLSRLTHTACPFPPLRAVWKGTANAHQSRAGMNPRFFKFPFAIFSSAILLLPPMQLSCDVTDRRLITTKMRAFGAPSRRTTFAV
jgi:hypothetical protein